MTMRMIISKIDRDNDYINDIDNDNDNDNDNYRYNNIDNMKLVFLRAQSWARFCFSFISMTYQTK